MALFNMDDQLSSNPRILLIAFAAVAPVVAFLAISLRGPLSHVPGPWHTLFTGLWLHVTSARGSRHHYLTRLHEKYGPIVRITPREVSVIDPEAVKDVFKASGGYVKSPYYTKLGPEPRPTLFSVTDSQVHGRMRKLLANSMSESNLKVLQPVVQEKLGLFISGLKKEMLSKGYVDLFIWTHYFSVDIISDLSFGKSMDTLKSGKNAQYVLDLEEMARINIARTVMTTKTAAETRDYPFWPFTKLKQLQDRIMDHTLTNLNNYREHAAHAINPKPMLFDKLMGSKGEEAGMNDLDIAANAQMYLAAGMDTVSISLMYLLWAVLTHPEVRAKLRKEISEANLPQQPSGEDLRGLEYLNNVINETMRMYGAATGPLPRTVPEGGRTLGEYFIPGGLVASPALWSLHRNPDIFPDPNTWNPDRWNDASKVQTEALRAFGGGNRVCIGLHLAKMEMRMATVAFMREFGDAEVAYGVNGFNAGDMDQLDFFLGPPKGERCFVRW